MMVHDAERAAVELAPARAIAHREAEVALVDCVKLGGWLDVIVTVGGVVSSVIFTGAESAVARPSVDSTQ